MHTRYLQGESPEQT